MPQMAVKIDLSASSPAFIPEQAFVVFVSCVVRERFSKVTPWDTFTCHLTSHPFMPQQSSIRALVSCTTHCTIHHCTVLVVFFFFTPCCQGPSLYPSPAANVLTLSQRLPNGSRQPISAHARPGAHTIRTTSSG